MWEDEIDMENKALDFFSNETASPIIIAGAVTERHRRRAKGEVMDPETREYLDGKWTLKTDTTGLHGAIYGPDGDPILRLDYNNAAHLLLARDVGEYLMELKRDRERLEWALETCLVHTSEKDFDTREQIDLARATAEKRQP